jgi:septal ring factor EnvC (AmiA/AmiB activator)
VPVAGRHEGVDVETIGDIAARFSQLEGQVGELERANAELCEAVISLAEMIEGLQRQLAKHDLQIAALKGQADYSDGERE